MILSIAISCSGCAGMYSVHETVLRPGEMIRATNKCGTIQVTYVSPTSRLCEWDNHRKLINLSPRAARWYGTLGLCPVGGLITFDDFDLIVEEGIKNFRTQAQMTTDLHTGSAVLDWVYDNHGLVVGFGKTFNGYERINLEIYQYLINGKKPASIPGARPSQISLKSFDPALTQSYNAKPGIKPQDEIPPLITDPLDPHGFESMR